MLVSVAQTLTKQFNEKPEFKDYKDQIKIRVTDEGLDIQIIDKDANVSFPSGQAELTPKAREILDVVAQSICGMPNQIKIAGHTDRMSYPEGSTYTNWELSTDRANAARRELEGMCLRPDRINAIMGYADSRPIVPEDPYAAANRRISIVVMRNNPMPKDGPPPPDEEGDREAASVPMAGAQPPSAATPSASPEPASNSQAPEPPSAPAKTEAHEAAAAEHRLATEGAVSVGTPDAPPTGVTRFRERPAKLEPHR